MGLQGSTVELMLAEMGHGGNSLIITDTAEHTGRWFKITVLETASITYTNSRGTNAATQSAPAGAELYGEFTAITLASGSVIAYEGPFKT